MITKINKVEDFGVFKSFDGSGLTEFKAFNLIYGWNYSGKTTLSRVFRCLEKGKLHDDYLSATFELESQAERYDNTFVTKPNIRVFNSDFIKENLKWDEENIEPIFILGAENIELQKELGEKEKGLAKAFEDLEEEKRLRQEKSNRISAIVTSKARDVGTLLGIRPFDSRHFVAVVDRVKTTPNTLNTAEFDKYKVQALSTEQKPSISELKISKGDLTKLITEVENILHRQAASNKKIQNLLNNKSISDWVETGKGLHGGKTDCEFCGNALPTDLMTKLNEHFSKDYDLLKSEIEAKLKNLEASKVSLTIPLQVETAFYTDIQPDFAIQKPLLEIEINGFDSSIDSLINDLKAKHDKPFDRLELTKANDNKTELETALAKFNEVIKTNENRTTDFTRDKSAAIEKLKEHFAADFEITETYSAIQTQLVNEQASINTKEGLIEAQRQGIAVIKAQLSESVKGAGKVNDYLKIFFGTDDMHIEAAADNKFKLVRGTLVAKNLSEGEKTAISFAYFTAKLEDQNNQIADTIVYIDDPISSLDANHLFNIYSFIKNTFYELKFDPALNKKTHQAKCKQLIISTHSFDFHNLIFDWFKSIGKNRQSFLIVERHKNKHEDQSILKENSNLLTRFNSEYAYLFSILYEFHTNPVDTYAFLYHLPNIARRFVETFLNFKYLTSTKLDESIDKFITDPIECERVRKFIHYYSHNLTTDKFMKFADLSECKDVIQIIMKSLDVIDPVHLASLKETVST